MRRILLATGLISAVTVFALFYVGLQIGLYKISYRLKEKEKLLSVTYDQFERLKMSVSQLKSPPSLEEKLSHSHLEFTFPHEVRLIGVSEKISEKSALADFRKLPSFMDFIKEAHARLNKEGT